MFRQRLQASPPVGAGFLCQCAPGKDQRLRVLGVLWATCGPGRAGEMVTVPHLGRPGSLAGHRNGVSTVQGGAYGADTPRDRRFVARSPCVLTGWEGEGHGHFRFPSARRDGGALALPVSRRLRGTQRGLWVVVLPFPGPPTRPW